MPGNPLPNDSFSARLDDGYDDDIAEEIVGHEDGGWLFGDEVYGSLGEAQLEAELTVRYDIQWVPVGRDRESPAAYWGAHPAVAQHLLDYGDGGKRAARQFTDESSRDLDAICKQHGLRLGYDTGRLWLTRERVPVRRRIADAVFPHAGSSYFARERQGGSWEVWKTDEFEGSSEFVSPAASKADAVVRAGEADYALRRARLEGGLALGASSRKPFVSSSALKFWAIIALLAAYHFLMAWWGPVEE